MPVFTAAPHSDILFLLFRVTLLLLTARLLGEIVQRLGQPSVVGEILAGIFLGPSCLSGFFPAVHHWIVPQTQLQGYLLEVVSFIGVMFLLLLTGLETDLALIRHHAKTGVGVSLGGFILPFVLGFGLGQLIPDALLMEPDKRIVFSLFLATAMSISAIPVIAKVLIDLNLIRRDIGQTIIAAGMCDDTIGWILLSIVAGLAKGQAIGFMMVFKEIGIVAGFMIFSFTIGRWTAKKSLDFVQDEFVSPYSILTLIMVFAFALGTLSQSLKLEAMLGAFVTGIIFGQMRRLPSNVYQVLENITLGIFAPIFFAVAGLKVNVKGLLEPTLLMITGIVILVATLGKVIGGYWGARWIGKRGRWTALSFGMAINARGAMEIIIATIGLSLGILSPNMFSIIVLMAIVTSLMAPTALRWTLRHIKPEEQELKRLREEELIQNSPIARMHRVLLPVRYREGQLEAIHAIKAYLLQRLEAKTKLSITILTIMNEDKRSDGGKFVENLSGQFLQIELIKKVVVSKKPVDVILQEAEKNYDLVLLGASEHHHNQDNIFSPSIDALVRFSPCSTMVVQGFSDTKQWKPNRIVVPTNGSLPSRRAAELAFLLASSENEIIFLSVIETNSFSGIHDASGAILQRQTNLAKHAAEELQELAQLKNIQTRVEVRVAADPETVILTLAKKEGVDLIILGTGVRPSSNKLFLGPRVERVLKSATCPVIVLNSA